MENRRAATLKAALGFAGLAPGPPELCLLHQYLDTWRGIGDIAAGMFRQGWDLQLTEYGDGHWRATFYVTGRRTPSSAAAHGGQRLGVRCSERRGTCSRERPCFALVARATKMGCAAALRSSLTRRRCPLGGAAHSPLDFLFRLFLRPPIPTLQQTNQLLEFSLDAIQFVVSELTPPGLCLATRLLPPPSEYVAIH